MTLTPPTSRNNGLPIGLTGATQATRYVGGTASGAPTAGTFAAGDFVVAQNGAMFVCLIAGTPGTWGRVGGLTSFRLGAAFASAGAAQATVSNLASFLLDGVALTGLGRCSVTTTPSVVGAGSAVLAFPPDVILTGVPNSSDALDVNAVWVVSNGAGSQQIAVGGNTTVPAHSGANAGLSFDWTTATVAGSTGADLSFSALTGAVSTTAGGTFTSVVVASCGWD